MTAPQPTVTTAWGGITLSDARALLEILDNRGFQVLRDLLAARHSAAIESLMSRSLPADEAMFERGVLATLQTVHSILLVLPKKVYSVLEHLESQTDGPDGNRSGPRPDEHQGERGPE